MATFTLSDETTSATLNAADQLDGGAEHDVLALFGSRTGAAMSKTPVRLVIADKHPVVLQGLISLLGSERTFTIVASCSNGTECVGIIRKLRPDVALLDMSMPGLNGLEILDIVRAEDL